MIRNKLGAKASCSEQNFSVWNQPDLLCAGCKVPEVGFALETPVEALDPIVLIVTLTVTVEFSSVIDEGTEEEGDELIALLVAPSVTRQMSLRAFAALVASLAVPQF